MISAPTNFNHISHMGPGEGIQKQRLIDLPTSIETADLASQQRVNLFFFSIFSTDILFNFFYSNRQQHYVMLHHPQELHHDLSYRHTTVKILLLNNKINFYPSLKKNIKITN